MNFVVPRNLERASFLLTILIVFTASVASILQSQTVILSTGSIDYRSTADGVILKDGFEFGSFSKWTSTYTSLEDSASVVSTNPYERKYHARFQTGNSASASQWAVCYHSTSPETTEIHSRGYFYIAEGLPLDDDGDRFTLIAIYDISTGYAQALVRIVRVSGVDKFQLSITSGDSYVAASTDVIYPREGVWYCIELYFRVDSTRGEGRVWINGIERIAVTDLDTGNHGNITQVHYGLISIGVQHALNLYVDVAVLSKKYVGQMYNFAVIGNPAAVPELKNVYWMLGNLSVTYKTLLPSEVTDESVFGNVDGVISFVSSVSGTLANASAVRTFAKQHVVVAHGYDFCYFYYPSFKTSYATISDVSTITYLIDWGNFRVNDRPELKCADNSLRVVKASSLSGFTNITKIAQYDLTHIAFFRMAGENVGSGFYVMDLYATRDSTLTANNWHLFPTLDLVRKTDLGKYARWLATFGSTGMRWYYLDWVNSFMQSLANNNPDLVQLHEFGTTVQGRSMYALFIGNGNRYVLIDGAMHGDEKTGTAAALRAAELLVEYYNSNESYWRSRLDSYTIIIVPVSNPDGYYAHTRTNANGKDLNRQYPPDGYSPQLSEPESQAFANLLANYEPTIFVNMHTGRFQMLFYQDSSSPLTEPHKTFALDTWNLAKSNYERLNYWGRISGSGSLGKIIYMGQSGLPGPVSEYAWWKHETISCLLEFYDSSSAYNLLGQEYFLSVIFTAIQNYDQILDIQAYSTGKISTTSVAANNYIMFLNTEELQTSSESKMYVGSRGKPATVVIDGLQNKEGDGWSWNDSSNSISVTGAKSSVSLSWTS